MPKHEPWFKPRADEDADEELINWLGGGSKPPPPPKKGGCLRVAAPVAVAIVLALAALLA